MKISAENMMAVNGVFQNLANEKMTVRLAYTIQKWCKSVESDVAFFGKKLTEIVSEFAERDENGNPVSKNGGLVIMQEKRSECEKALKELREMEIEVPDVRLTLEDLAPLSMTPQQISAIDPILEVEE